MEGAALAEPPTESRPVLSTGITGSLTASGVESPIYVLSFPEVQRLMLAAAASPLKADAGTALAGTPVRLSDLVRLGLLREEAGVYRLNYLILTVEDQRRIYRIAKAFGEDLAGEIRRSEERFDRILTQYPFVELRSQVKFTLIAGMLLNWEGLELSTRLGYLAEPTKLPNGDRYLVHSTERGADLELKGMYLGSESWPARSVTVTTFGDPESFPRSRGLPNVFEPAFDGLESVKQTPELYAATRGLLLTYLAISVGDAGEIMLALRNGVTARAELAERLSLPSDRLDASLRLLLAMGYVREDGPAVKFAVPVLSAMDEPMVKAVLELGREILTNWLSRNIGPMQDSLRDLTPLQNGLPFNVVFGEVWHHVFGFATSSLAEQGFYVNPRAADWPYPGYVPLVWATTLYEK